MSDVMLRRSTFALFAFASLTAPVSAQSYPSKPITLIVPFAAGGPTDLMARIVGERMGKELGQQIVIDNVTGAAGTIAMAKLAHAAPDGYTIGIGHLGTNVVNGLIYKNLNYDLLDDLVPYGSGLHEPQRYLPLSIRSIFAYWRKSPDIHMSGLT